MNAQMIFALILSFGIPAFWIFLFWRLNKKAELGLITENETLRSKIEESNRAVTKIHEIQKEHDQKNAEIRRGVPDFRAAELLSTGPHD